MLARVLCCLVKVRISTPPYQSPEKPELSRVLLSKVNTAASAYQIVQVNNHFQGQKISFQVCFPFLTLQFDNQPVVEIIISVKKN